MPKWLLGGWILMTGGCLAFSSILMPVSHAMSPVGVVEPLQLVQADLPTIAQPIGAKSLSFGD